MTVHSDHVVVTSAVPCWAEVEPDRQVWLLGCLARHLTGDWGDLDAEDGSANDHALRRRRGRLLSAYELPDELAGASINNQVWVITDDLEDPDTATTILWPSDY